MRINTKCDFKFNVSVSTTHYEGKCNEWGKLRYQTKEVTIDEQTSKVKSKFGISLPIIKSVTFKLIS